MNRLYGILAKVAMLAGTIYFSFRIRVYWMADDWAKMGMCIGLFVFIAYGLMRSLEAE